MARARSEQRPLALVMLDLNGFKPVNDELGHPSGDTLLQAVAARLREGLRDTDRVARIGGDEFGVILEDCECRADVAQVAEKIYRLVAEPIELRGRNVRVTASIGVANASVGPSVVEVMRSAESAMKRAAERGGDTICIGEAVTSQPVGSGA